MTKDYQEELKNQYDQDVIEQAREYINSMSESDLKKSNQIEDQMIELLKNIHDDKDVDSKNGQTIFKLHQKYLKLMWPKYTVKRHQQFAEQFDDPKQPYFEYLAQRTGNDDSPIFLKEIIFNWINKK